MGPDEKAGCIKEPEESVRKADYIDRILDRVALVLGVPRSMLDGGALSEAQAMLAMDVITLILGCKKHLVMKPFFPEIYRAEYINDVAAVLDARIRPKRKRKLLMAMGFSRNEARKLAFRGGADWRYRAEE